jgi:microcystin-dependent protein
MSNPYIGEIRMFAGNFAPLGWMLCQGQTLPISQYDALFALIGTTYGGDGQTTFNLPNLSSRVPMHQGTGGGNNYVLGQMAGQESVTLTTPQMPSHTHPMPCAASNSNSAAPAGAFCGATSSNAYASPAPNASMNPASVSSVGGNQPHDNMMPYLAINFIISLFGIFPSQS